MPSWPDKMGSSGSCPLAWLFSSYVWALHQGHILGSPGNMLSKPPHIQAAANTNSQEGNLLLPYILIYPWGKNSFFGTAELIHNAYKITRLRGAAEGARGCSDALAGYRGLLSDWGKERVT
eukprot:661763-Pelagomonas_calceolata.AAC.4